MLHIIFKYSNSIIRNVPKKDYLSKKFENATRLWKKREYEKSLLVINQLLLQKPNNESFLGFKAMLLVRLKKIKESIRINEKLLKRKIEPDLKKLLLITKIEQLLVLKKSSEANKICDEMLKKFPKSHPVLEYKGNILIMQRKYSQSIKYLKEALKYSKKCQSCLVVLGKTYQKLKHTEKALTYFKKTLKINPKNLTALKHIYEYYISKKQFIVAIKFIDKNIELKKDDYIAYAYKGDCLQVLKHYEEAIDCYNKALKFHQNLQKHNKKCNFEVNVNTNYIIALINIKKFSNALKLANKTLLRDKENKNLKSLKKYILKKHERKNRNKD